MTSCHPGFGLTTGRGDFTGRRQVITRDCLGPGPRVFCDLSRQFLGVDRLPAMLGREELPGHIGPHPRARSAGSGAPTGRPAAVMTSPRSVLPLRRNGLISPSTILNGTPSLAASKVALGEVGSFQVLLPQLG